MTARFPELFSAVRVGGCTIPNRVVFTGHHTYLADRIPGDALIAYLEQRAKGGAGLIVSEIVAVHPSARSAPKLLLADCPEVVPHYRRLAAACQAHGARIFAQLFHPGREILSAGSGMAAVAWAPSSVPNERFHIMPRALSTAMIDTLIAGYAQTAYYLSEAGFDGFEIVASHGYLPAQFLNPRVNRRDDDYGGDAERRLVFLQKLAAAVRARIGERVLGLRISASELDPGGLGEDDMLPACRALAAQFDYFSVVVGTSASLGGSVHIVPPMGIDNAYIAPFSRRVKAVTQLPVIATGRINQPQEAEQLIARGDADLCGMTRALICDPNMAALAQAGNSDDIRACIGCNQSCIGRAHKGLPISCIQHPESGRELEFRTPPITACKNILVVGGGVAGMKAAAVLAGKGHRVAVYEKHRQPGGQCRLAMQLPGRAEFGGIIANLEREMRRAGAVLETGAALERSDILALHEESRLDHVVIATGATPYLADFQGREQDNVVQAWDVISGQCRPGARVVIADWNGDWIGVGVAELLAASGCRVTLCVNAAMAGESMQIYTRNHFLGRIKALGVDIATHLRLFGIDEHTVYFQHVLTGEPVIEEDVDSLVLSLGQISDDALEQALINDGFETSVIGDGRAPRTAEEAVYEGLTAGWVI